MNAPEHIGLPIGPRGKNAAAELTGLNKAWGLLPHEVFFGIFLLVTWVRLGVVVGWLSGDALIYLGLIVLYLAASW